jgi:Ca2+-binding EF-hand superfamily protein
MTKSEFKNLCVRIFHKNDPSRTGVIVAGDQFKSLTADLSYAFTGNEMKSYADKESEDKEMLNWFKSIDTDDNNKITWNELWEAV